MAEVPTKFACVDLSGKVTSLIHKLQGAPYFMRQFGALIDQVLAGAQIL